MLDLIKPELGSRYHDWVALTGKSKENAHYPFSGRRRVADPC
jgi:hypothetical protein